MKKEIKEKPKCFYCDKDLIEISLKGIKWRGFCEYCQKTFLFGYNYLLKKWEYSKEDKL